MDFSEFPIFNYPTGEVTDPSVLQASLGSFWNIVFNEKATITGYTTGLAEELIQSYYDLIDVIKSYSVFDIPVLNKEKWYPLIVKLSDYNSSPLLFNPNDAVFGPQPASDQFYNGQVFQFGKPKNPNANVYTVAVPSSFANFFTIANRVISPTALYVNGIDVVLKNNTLFFNQNIFSDPRNTQYPIINQSGVPATFVDSKGNTVNDVFIVLWVYHCEVDNNNLTDNFGYIYNLTLPSTETSKNLIKALVSLSVGGATIRGVKAALGAFAGIPTVIEDGEVVEYISFNSVNTVVATNAHVYKFDPRLTLLPTVTNGVTFNAGDIMVDAIQYYDNSVLPNWWDTVFKNDPQVAFSSNIFLGSYSFQLFFKNTIDLVTLSDDGTINFPVEGRPADVATFESYINQPANATGVKAAFGLSYSTDPTKHRAVVPINPVDFLFQNFFKDNMALFKIGLYDVESTSSFLDYMDLIKDMLPPQVFILFDIDIDLPMDTYNELNNTLTIPDLSGLYSADGSNAVGNIASVSPYFYKNIATRLFALGKAPNKSGNPLTDSSNLDKVHFNTESGGQAYAVSAKVFRGVPTGATTATYPTLSIIDFSSPYE
jgi:hypothetical protein